MKSETTIYASNLALAPATSDLTLLTDDELDAVGGGWWPMVVGGAALAGYLIGKYC